MHVNLKLWEMVKPDAMRNASNGFGLFQEIKSDTERNVL